MNQGVIPPDMLLVLICPVHKGGSRADPAQYRPVALTSHIVRGTGHLPRAAGCSTCRAAWFLGAEVHADSTYVTLGLGP